MKYDETFMQMVLTGEPVTEIMKRTGLSRSAVYRRMNDDDFQQELTRRRTEAVKAALSKMQVNLSTIIQIALDLAQDARISPQIRLNACQIILTQCDRWTQTTDVMTRLSEIERKLDAEGVKQ